MKIREFVGRLVEGISYAISPTSSVPVEEKGVVGPLRDDERIYRSLRQILQLQGEGVTQPYSQSIWVYSCVHTISQNISQVPCNLVSKGKGFEGKKVVKSGPLYKLFTQPNPLMNGTQLIEATQVFLGLYGESFWVMSRPNVAAIPEEIWCPNPDRFTPIVSKDSGVLKGWEYKVGNKENDVITFAAHEVIQFKYFNPYDDIRGLSPVNAARLGVDQDYYSSVHNKNFFKEGAVVPGFITAKTFLTDKQYNRILNQFEDRHKSYKKAFRIGVLEGGADFKESKISQKDMDFVLAKEANRREILAAYKCNEVVLGIYRDIKSYEGIRASHQSFWRECLLPKIYAYEETLWSHFFQYIGGGSVWCEFDTNSVEALQEDFARKVAIADQLFKMSYPINMINARLNLGMKNVPWGDTGFLQTNVLPVGAGASGANLPNSTDGDSEPLEGPDDKGLPWFRSRAMHTMDGIKIGDLTKPFERLETTLKQYKPEEVKVEPPPAEETTISYTQEELFKLKDFLVRQGEVERKFEKKLKAFFFKQRKRALKGLYDYYGKKKEMEGVVTKDLTDDMLNRDEEIKALVAATIPLYKVSIQIGVEMVIDELGVEGFVFRPLDPSYIGAMDVRLSRIPMSIIDTIRDKLRKTLREGLLLGENVVQLANRVRREYNFTQGRAMVIARTESASSINLGRFTEMKNQGVKFHRWLTAGDEHVRISHQSLHNKVTAVGEPFPGSQLRYPGDSQAPPQEVVNCRCTTLPVLEQ